MMILGAAVIWALFPFGILLFIALVVATVVLDH